MRLVINGEERDFSGISTLASLVDQLALKADRLAIELNRDIIRRDAWEATYLKEGDRLEIVHFVGGGRLEPWVVKDACPGTAQAEISEDFRPALETSSAAH